MHEGGAAVSGDVATRRCRALLDAAFSNVDGDSNYVRVQVLTNAGALDRDKQLAVVRQFTDQVATACNYLIGSYQSWSRAQRSGAG
jgi:hypothetical protein